MKKFVVSALLLGVVLIAPDLITFAHDQRALAQVAQSPNLSGATHAIARSLQQAVFQQVKVVKDGKFYHVNARPRLRHRAWETWQHGEGQCGEGARLLVNLLLSRGIAASRLNLSNSVPPRYHTVVAYWAEGDYWLLDSINSTPEFQAWTQAQPRRVRDLLQVRLHEGGALMIKPQTAFYDRYGYFPWAKVLGDRVEINQFRPFPVAISLLMENPPLLLACFKLLLWAGVVGLTLMGYGLWLLKVWFKQRHQQ